MQRPEPNKPPKPAKTRVLPVEAAAWFPPTWDKADCAAFQALEKGIATPEQQQRALRFLVEKLCATYDLSFRPGGQEASRESDFAEGRRFVGLQVVKLVKFNLATIRKEPTDE